MDRESPQLARANRALNLSIKNEPRHEISNNVVKLEHSMTVKLLTEHHLEF